MVRPEIGNDDIVAKAESDKLLTKGLLEFFRQCWLGGTGIAYTDPRVSLLHADLVGLAPTSLHWGDAEILAGEAVAFGERLVDAGVDARIHPLADGQHSFVIAGGRVPEVDDAITGMGTWLRDKLGVK